MHEAIVNIYLQYRQVVVLGGKHGKKFCQLGKEIIISASSSKARYTGLNRVLCCCQKPPKFSKGSLIRQIVSRNDQTWSGNQQRNTSGPIALITWKYHKQLRLAMDFSSWE